MTEDTISDVKKISREKKLLRQRRWAQNNPEKRKLACLRWQLNNPEKYTESRRRCARRSYNKSRQIIMDILGGKCVTCGFGDRRALQFDHINGNGAQEIKGFDGACNMYRYYCNYPDLLKERIQLLCANCNWIKRHVKNEHANKVPAAKRRIKKRAKQKNGRLFTVIQRKLDYFL